MSRIYKGGSAESRYQQQNVGQSYNPVRAADNSKALRGYKDQVIQDGETKRRDLDRAIKAQNTAAQLSRNAESSGLKLQNSQAQAELKMQQKYDTNTLKQAHNYEASQMKMDLAELTAQGQVDAANTKALSTTVTGLLSFAGTAVSSIAKINAAQEVAARQDSIIDATFGQIDASTPAAHADATQSDIRDTEFDVATETGIQQASSDPSVQNSIRQEHTAPTIAAEQVRKGNAYAAAQDYGSFHNSWVNDQGITYTRSNGSTFTAATASTRADLLQIDSAAKKAFLRAANVAGMPRAQIANVLAPVVQNTSSSWVTTNNGQITAANKAAALKSAEVSIFDGLAAGDDLQAVFSEGFRDLFASGGYARDKGKATADTVKTVLNWAVQNNRPDVIDGLEKVFKITKDGVGQQGTQLGRQYVLEFEAAREDVIQEQLTDNQRDRAVATDQVNTINRNLISDLAATDQPGQERALNLAAADALDATSTPEGRQRAAELRGMPEYSPFTVEDIREQRANGVTRTNEELTDMVTSGNLTSEEAKSVGWDPKGGSSADTQRAEALKPFKAEATSQGKAAVTAALSAKGSGASSLDGENKRLIMEGIGASAVKDISDRIMTALDKEYQASVAIGKPMDSTQIREFITDQGAQMAGEVVFNDMKLEYQFGDKDPKRTLFVVGKPTDPSVKALNLTGFAPSELYYMPADSLDDNAILDTREMAIANAAITNGKALPQYIEDKARALGTNAETLLRSQNVFYGGEQPLPPAPPATPTRVSGGGSGSDAELSKYDTGETYGDISLDRARNSIINKESAGNMSAVNPHSGALGWGQVMPANVKSWSTAALGYAVSQREFLRNPDIQMAVINDRFRKMLQQQSNLGYTGDILMRRVAAEWYSGRPNLYNNTNAQTYGAGSYPSISSYTLDVVSRYRS